MRTFVDCILPVYRQLGHTGIQVYPDGYALRE